MKSKDFDKIKRYYDMGLWNIKMVENDVKQGKITEDEFYEITGVEYEA